MEARWRQRGLMLMLSGNIARAIEDRLDSTISSIMTTQLARCHRSVAISRRRGQGEAAARISATSRGADC